MAARKVGASRDAPTFFIPGRIRWGLCCQFLDSPIKFRSATHRYCATLPDAARSHYLSDIVLANARSLVEAIETCTTLGIGAFRVTSQLLPLATHPISGYSIEDLPDSQSILDTLTTARDLAKASDVRLSFHPDQFVVLNSESEAVVESSLREMSHQGSVAQLIGAEALTLHAGGAVGGSKAALTRLAKSLDRLTPAARELLALENDDRSFSPADLIPFCENNGIPFVYDVHHHRCRKDDMTVAEASERGAATWKGREPWMHISSPRDGWNSLNPRSHAEFIDPQDVPREWIGKRMTVDVEAKSKERAVLAIIEQTGPASPE